MSILSEDNHKLRVALIILYDEDNRVLLQHRTEDAKILPGYWGFFGGGIDDGETPEQAVRREAMEELNCELKNERLFVEQDFVLPNAEGHMHLFIAPFYGDKSSISLNEGCGWGWFGEEEIDRLKMLQNDRNIVKAVISHIKCKKIRGYDNVR